MLIIIFTQTTINYQNVIVAHNFGVKAVPVFIEIKNLTVSFNGINVLKNVN